MAESPQHVACVSAPTKDKSVVWRWSGPLNDAALAALVDKVVAAFRLKAGARLQREFELDYQEGGDKRLILEPADLADAFSTQRARRDEGGRLMLRMTPAVDPTAGAANSFVEQLAAVKQEVEQAAAALQALPASAGQHLRSVVAMLQERCEATEKKALPLAQQLAAEKADVQLHLIRVREELAALQQSGTDRTARSRSEPVRSRVAKKKMDAASPVVMLECLLRSAVQALRVLGGAAVGEDGPPDSFPADFADTEEFVGHVGAQLHFVNEVVLEEDPPEQRRLPMAQAMEMFETQIADPVKDWGARLRGEAGTGDFDEFDFETFTRELAQHTLTLVLKLQHALPGGRGEQSSLLHPVMQAEASAGVEGRLRRMLGLFAMFGAGDDTGEAVMTAPALVGYCRIIGTMQRADSTLGDDMVAYAQSLPGFTELPHWLAIRRALEVE